MKFIDRKRELARLEDYYSLSKKQLMTVAISGLRRVGKTALVKEFIGDKTAIYFFVYESKTSVELLREFSEELRRHKVITEIENIDSWHTFFEVVFKRCRDWVVVFDEFQNFYKVDKTVFSIMQRGCDEYTAVPMNIILLGSLVGLFKKIFEDMKQPLYGRVSAKVKLEPFTLKHSIETLRYLKYSDMEDMLTIYGLFGGFPKYYASVEQFDLNGRGHMDLIRYLFIQENAPLENEVEDILKQEFGRRSSLYYSILHSIATGKMRLNELANNIHMKDSSITRHLSELEKKFGLIKSVRPIDNTKNTRYVISHPLIRFWFRFVYDKFSEYRIQDTDDLVDSIKQDFNSFLGGRFEEICKEFVLQLNAENKLPFRLDYINNWWGSARLDGVRQSVEIDIIGLNQKSKQIIFTECKWKDNVDAEKVLKQLKSKIGYVNWQRDSRQEYFCLIAKSFKRRTDEKNVLLFDLKDIAKEVC